MKLEITNVPAPAQPDLPALRDLGIPRTLQPLATLIREGVYLSDAAVQVAKILPVLTGFRLARLKKVLGAQQGRPKKGATIAPLSWKKLGAHQGPREQGATIAPCSWKELAEHLTGRKYRQTQNYIKTAADFEQRCPELSILRTQDYDSLSEKKRTAIRTAILDQMTAARFAAANEDSFPEPPACNNLEGKNGADNPPDSPEEKQLQFQFEALDFTGFQHDRKHLKPNGFMEKLYSLAGSCGDGIRDLSKARDYIEALPDELRAGFDAAIESIYFWRKDQAKKSS